MKALDLNRLNVKAPYSVWEAGKQSYGFKTDYGVLFRIVFIDDQTIWDNGSYEFAILNENNKPSPNDGKVKNRFHLHYKIPAAGIYILKQGSRVKKVVRQ